MAHQCVLAIPLALVCAMGGPVGLEAQTAIVPINHRVSGNFTFRLLDLNTASTNELTRVLGLDEALAKKIIQGRPYRTPDELVHRGLIPATTYARIETRLVVKSLPR